MAQHLKLFSSVFSFFGVKPTEKTEFSVFRKNEENVKISLEIDPNSHIGTAIFEQGQNRLTVSASFNVEGIARFSDGKSKLFGETSLAKIGQDSPFAALLLQIGGKKPFFSEKYRFYETEKLEDYVIA